MSGAANILAYWHIASNKEKVSIPEQWTNWSRIDSDSGTISTDEVRTFQLHMLVGVFRTSHKYRLPS